MTFDVSQFAEKNPAEMRRLIRTGGFSLPTAGVSRGYAQANLIILPRTYAADFEEFTIRNPFACPVLERVEGTPQTHLMAANGNIVTDIPAYLVYENGVKTRCVNDASSLWTDKMVGFLIGCSFSFEEALICAGIEIRHIALGCNVPMYKTNRMTVKAGPFQGPTVCSMRPMTPEHAEIARSITEKMPNVHGAPIHIGDPAEIGINDIMQPDYGDAVEVREGEVPVFWPCGVTPQAAVENAKPEIAISHAPGYMFLTDILNCELNNLLQAQK